MKAYIRCTALRQNDKSSLVDEVYSIRVMSEFIKRLAFLTEPDDSDIEVRKLIEVRMLILEDMAFDCQCFLDAAKKSLDNQFYKLYGIHTDSKTIICPAEVKKLYERLDRFKRIADDDAKHNFLEGVDIKMYEGLLGLFKLASAYEDGFVTFTQFYKLQGL